jgi:hypothetical protein
MSVKISALPGGDVLDGTELIPIVQGGATVKVTAEQLNTRQLTQIDLTSFDYNVTKSGIYFITVGSSGLSPNSIMLSNPTTMPGAELLFFNYDQTNGADFAGDYQPLLEASTSSGDKYVSIPSKQAVKVVSVNGYWSALSYKL